jgi:hypothetical protein
LRALAERQMGQAQDVADDAEAPAAKPRHSNAARENGETAPLSTWTWPKRRRWTLRCSSWPSPSTLRVLTLRRRTSSGSRIPMASRLTRRLWWTHLRRAAFAT